MKTLLWFCGFTLAAVLVAFLTQSMLRWPFWTVFAITEAVCFAVAMWQILPKIRGTSTTPTSQQTEEKEKMNKVIHFLLYTGAAILVALLIKLVSGWSFWAIFVLAELGYFSVTLWQSYPKLAKWLAGLGAIFLAIQLFSLWFSYNFPLSWDTLPNGIGARDAQIARAMDKGLAKADHALIIALRDQEDRIAAKLPALVEAKNTNEIATLYLQQVQIRQNIEAIMSSNRAPATSQYPLPTPARGGIASFTVNKGERKATVSHPDKTVVHFEANKAFAILERNGTRSDGSFILTPIDMPPGKSQRYFAWGGSPYIEGLHDGTQITVSY